MNSKNLDAIKRMVTRLQSIRETEFLSIPIALALSDAKYILQAIVTAYDAHTPSQNSEEIRTE